MTPYRVLVVDDSIFMRKIISDLVGGDSRFEVVATARNGQEAVDMAKTLQPDAITMDIEMPVMSGLEALERIMQECPTPVVMLSSLTKEGADETIRALELGAIDFVCKPSGSISLDLFKVKEMLLEKLTAAASIKLSKAKAKMIQTQTPLHAVANEKRARGKVYRPGKFSHLVAIGTSTGGPRALYEVLTQLPAEFPAPILIVQHMPPNFTKSLAQRLHASSQIRVVEAEDRLPVHQGVAYIAPGGWHMKLLTDDTGQYMTCLTKEAPTSGHRPSVDVLFESLLPFVELQRHAVIMTGMGRDGAAGMKALKDHGAVTTIAESAETCVIYGMPKSAIELGGVTDILPRHQIADKLIRCVNSP